MTQLIVLNDLLRLIDPRLYQFQLIYGSIQLHGYNSAIKDTMKLNKLADDTNNDIIFQINLHNPKKTLKVIKFKLHSFPGFLNIFLNEIIHNLLAKFDLTLLPFYPKIDNLNFIYHKINVHIFITYYQIAILRN